MILHLEMAANDAQCLLECIGTWQKYGAMGWGDNGQWPIFVDHNASGAGQHATWANEQVLDWYTPESECIME